MNVKIQGLTPLLYKCEEIHESIIEMMWILTESPDLYKNKVDELHNKINIHALSA